MGIIGGFLKRRRREKDHRDQARGRSNEEIVLKALSRASRPDWILEVRTSSKGQDRRGIDIVVETVDCGTLYLQVKSSETGAAEWREREARRAKQRPIEVIVVPRDADLNTVYGLALGALIKIRERHPLSMGKGKP